MTRYPEESSEGRGETSREVFADGSVLIDFGSGGFVIQESELAGGATTAETGSAMTGSRPDQAEPKPEKVVPVKRTPRRPVL